MSSSEVTAPVAPDATVLAKRSSRKVAWLLFGFLVAVYLLTGKGFSEILDAEGYYVITKAMVEEHTVAIEPDLTKAIVRGVEPVRNGKTYLPYGIGYPLLLSPFYLAGKVVGEVVVSFAPSLERFDRFFPRAGTSTALALITALTAVAVLYLLMEFGWSLRVAAAGGLLFGLATYAWPYAKIGFYEPFLTLCQALALLWAVVYARTGNWRWLLGAWFVVGWGMATKPSLLLLAPVLVGYVVWAAWRGFETPKERAGATDTGGLRRVVTALVASGIGLAPWVVLMFWYNHLRTGAVTNPGYLSGNYTPFLAGWHFVQAMVGNLFSPGRSFFVYSPIAILFLAGIPWYWRNRRPELVAMVALFVLNFGFFALRENWATIRPWGPRYLEPLTPLFVLMAMPGIAALWSKVAWRRVVYGLVALSVVVQLLAIAVPYGNWLDRVREAEGSAFEAVFRLKYWPVWGQVVLLSEATLEPIEVHPSEISEGQPSEAFKTVLRASPDFWWAYLYRLGVPVAPVVLLMVALLACAIVLARRLWCELRIVGEASSEVCGALG